jgi:hypothetical protein
MYIENYFQLVYLILYNFMNKFNALRNKNKKKFFVQFLELDKT